MDKLTGNQASIYIYAARYAHTRNTGAALQIVTEILHVWDSLPEDVQEQLKREADNEATCNGADWYKITSKG